MPPSEATEPKDPVPTGIPVVNSNSDTDASDELPGRASKRLKRADTNHENDNDDDDDDDNDKSHGTAATTTTTTTTSSSSSSSTASTASAVVAVPSASSSTGADDKLQMMEKACRTILECIGEDPEREGLLKTPTRWAKALLFMTQGYSLTCQQVTNGAVFSEHHNGMVVVRDIDIHSLCEHHMVPFTGRVHIGYIPDGKVIGLSKLARIAEVYSRRLQVQERLTQQIADALVDVISPRGVAVAVESSHLCMVMRGVQKVGSSTFTSCFRGCFETDSIQRSEFLTHIQSTSSSRR